MKEIHDYIEKELHFLHQNLTCYLDYWPKEAEQIGQPSRSLLELASHLYALPAAYCALFDGAREEDLLKLWAGPWQYRSTDDLRDILNTGMTAIMSHKYLSTNDRLLLPWPFGDPISPQQHLINLITHMYHHRGQMHLLLKQAGANVDTGTVYMTSEGSWRTD